KGSETIEWIGKSDGTYSVRSLKKNHSPGTRIYLRCKQGSEDFFQLKKLKKLLTHYGCFLPCSITLSDTESHFLIHQEKPFSFDQESIRNLDKKAVLEYGRSIFDEEFIDFIPLSSETGDVSGIAFVISHKINPTVRKKHRVYIKKMFLSESVDNLLPDWAFFVRCIVNANNLQPTASREEIYEDIKLIKVQHELSNCIREYFINKAAFDTQTLQKIISIHRLAIKAMAIDDNELYELVVRWLPFETSLGDLTIEEIFKKTTTIQYTPNIDEFRQIQRISAAKSFCILNCGYVYDIDMVEKLPNVFPDIEIERIRPTDISESFTELSHTERELAYAFTKTANAVLQEYHCCALIKKFIPKELPALFIIDEEADFLRNINNTKEISNPLFSSVLGDLSQNIQASTQARLCFNFNNPIIGKLIESQDSKIIQMSTEIIYIQSLLLGHYPLNNKEMKLLNGSLLNLIEHKL
ncbi:HSP90 family protein, partial [Balneolaceae bacterium ANBcel3]|nr:HSP90 family protein [Balneolaceae bacterium ANBcel3]